MGQSGRTGIEKNWYALTGRVVAVKAETDGDVHIELQDATGNRPGIVIVEIPAKPQWCDVRKTVFSWTRTRFPLHVRSARKLTINQGPIITVIGKAFWDIGHAPKDESNRRSHLPGCAAWEIHPAILREWRNPRHEEFHARTLWTLFNSFTEVLKGNLNELPRRTEALHGLLDSAVGLATFSHN